MSRRFAGISFGCTAILFGAGATCTPQPYIIGNATPAAIYSVQGQSFTPSVAGNESSGSAPATSPGIVYLTSFTIDYDFSAVATPSASLYIFESTPSVADAATGTGSLATGTRVSGGNYSFNRVPLNFNTRYYAVLPGPASIFDNSGDAYTGGGDMFTVGGIVAEGSGDFDIGFNATFE